MDHVSSSIFQYLQTKEKNNYKKLAYMYFLTVYICIDFNPLKNAIFFKFPLIYSKKIIIYTLIKIIYSFRNKYYQIAHLYNFKRFMKDS